MTDDSPHWLLLDRYLAGELSPAERQQFEQWIVQSAERRAWVESLRRITDATSSPSARQTATDAAWQRTARRLHIARDERDSLGLAAPAADPGIPSVIRPAERASRRSWARGGPSRANLAMAGAFVAGVVLLALTVTRSDRGRATLPHRFATRTGEQADITLSDGTSIILAPASVLTVASSFGHDGRDVTLDGEGSFTVAHDARQPFTVHTSWAALRDVGTSFVVRAYASDGRARVAVREGAVSVMSTGTHGTAATLRAREAASVDASGTLVVGDAGEADALLAWVRGGIVFNDVTLGDAARDLSRSFGLHILIPDESLARLPITAKFADEPIEVILDDLTAIVGARYERSGRTVVIRRRARRSARPAVHDSPTAPPSSVVDPHS